MATRDRYLVLNPQGTDDLVDQINSLFVRLAQRLDNLDGSSDCFTTDISTIATSISSLNAFASSIPALWQRWDTSREPAILLHGLIV